MKIYRQGDVLLASTNDEPANFKKVARDKGRVVLAYGEVTGHAHAIKERDAVLFDNGKGIRILSVESEANLCHEEHSTITLPKGNYRVIQQREYSPAAIRNVRD